MSEFSPPNRPLEEEYWETLIKEGEQRETPAPPAPPQKVWEGLKLGIMEEEPAFSSDGHSGHGWTEAMKIMREERVLELPVVGFNRGGLLVEWNGRQGFVPASHLEDLDPFLREEERERSLRAQMGRCLKLKVIEVDPERRRLVLSERATRSDENRRKAFLKQLTPGEIRKGRVTNIRSFGAFVDLGEGVEGLIHISEISWGRVNHPSDALHPGQEIDVYILNVDRERGRVGLSIKRTQPDPWETLERDYEVGQVVEGLITNVVNFGAFAEVEKGLEGLIHVSELAEGNFLHPRNVVQEGDTVQALIINMDGERRRLGLSLRRAPSVEAPEPEGPTIPSEE